MTMEVSFKILLVAFAVGLLINRHMVVRIALVTGLALGAVYAAGLERVVGHTLAEAFSFIT